MRLAKALADDNDACFSRKIGCLIVNPESNNVVGLGYNGPPQGTPHCNSQRYLQTIFCPQLSDQELELATKSIEKLSGQKSDVVDSECDVLVRHVRTNFISCEGSALNTCPRRFINAGPGERSELCTCEHAERNSIYNAQGSTVGCYIFCYCPLPCLDCCKAIIGARIKRVYCLKINSYRGEKDYSPTSRWLLHNAKVEVLELDKETI